MLAGRILKLIDDHSRLAIASVDTHHRVRTDRVDDTGSITLRLAGIADPKAKSRASPAAASDELSRGGSKLDCGPQLAPGWTAGSASRRYCANSSRPAPRAVAIY